VRDGAVDELDGAVVPDAEAFGDRRNGGPGIFRQALDGEQ
jgi:hypothetical protein